MWHVESTKSSRRSHSATRNRKIWSDWDQASSLKWKSWKSASLSMMSSLCMPCLWMLSEKGGKNMNLELLTLWKCNGACYGEEQGGNH